MRTYPVSIVLWVGWVCRHCGESGRCRLTMRGRLRWHDRYAIRVSSESGQQYSFISFLESFLHTIFNFVPTRSFLGSNPFQIRMLFFNRLLTTTRTFSTSAVQLFPKLKSHSGAKKRWRSLSNGKFKRVCDIC